jgi:hypothetical protein
MKYHDLNAIINEFNIQPTFKFEYNNDYCYLCVSIKYLDDGFAICSKCGIMSQIINSNYNNYEGTEYITQITQEIYTRILYFKKVIKRYCGQEGITIPNNIMDKIRSRIKIEKINELSFEQLEKILIVLKLGKYIEHLYYIGYKLGLQPPLISEEIEIKLCNLFLVVEEIWNESNQDKKNLLNYNFILHKLLLHIGEKSLYKCYNLNYENTWTMIKKKLILKTK